MHTPAVALLWQTWGRYRWALAALALGFLAVMGFQRTLSFELVTSNTGFALTVIPLGLFFACAIFIFSHGEAGQRANSSSFPGWMFQLPVRTSQLVVWPMLGGAVAMAVMWVASTQLVFRKIGVDLPVWWPALCLAATLAWLQAIDWSPLGLANKALLAGGTVTAVWSTSYAVVEKYGISDWRALPLVLFLPAAYAAALAGVSSARHGAAEGRAGWQVLFESATRWLPERRRPFATTARAQLWLEWRRCGILIPAVLAGWLLLLGGLSLLMGRDIIDFGCLLTLQYMVPGLSPLAGSLLGKPEVWSRQFRLSSYTAGRPLTSGSLATARILAVVAGLWLGYVLLAAAGALDITAHGVWESYQGLWRSVTRTAGGTAPAIVTVLFLVSLVGVTTLQLVGHLCAGLSGRFWILAATVAFYLFGVPNLIAIDSSLRTSGTYRVAVMDILPWVVRGMIVLKFLAAAGVVFVLLSRRLAGAAFVAAAFVAWLVVAGSLFGYLALRTGSGDWAFPASVAVLSCPLTRVLLGAAGRRMEPATLRFSATVVARYPFRNS